VSKYKKSIDKILRKKAAGGGIMGSNNGSMLVANTADGTRPGYFGSDAGFGNDSQKDAESNFDGGSGQGISDAGAARALANNASLRAGVNNAASAKAAQAKAAQAKQAAIQKELDKYRGKTPAGYSYGKVKINPYNFSKRQPGVIGFGAIPTAINLAKKYSTYKKNKEIRARLGLDPVDEIAMDMPNAPFGRSTVNINEGDGSETYLPTVNYNTGALEAEVEAVEPYNQFSYNEDAFGAGGDSADVTRASYDFNEGGRAGGGIMGTRARRAFGGIMDRVTGRKAYGLGSIFKSVGKAVKGVAKAAGKVLKSDAGKMALMAAGAYYTGGGMNFGGAKMFGNTGFGKAGFMNNMGRIGGSLFGQAGSRVGEAYSPFKQGLLPKLGLTRGGGSFMPTLKGAGALGFGALSLFGREAKPNEVSFSDRGGPLLNSQGDGSQGSISKEIQEAYAAGDSEKIAQLQKYYNYMLPSQDAVQDLSLPSSLPYPNYAEGGRINKAEGGLMDLGGMEKDYRNDGGFVPIGEYEKKDDVPARLSVNEFVFTADAVRGAGGGDIDKGAEIMENVMKNLEGGGQMSKESQGNTGAQDMFSVSQRLGEVL